MLDRDEILGLVPHVGCGISLVGLATWLLGLVDRDGIIEPCVQVGREIVRLIFDAHQGGREPRNLPLLGEHQRDRLAIELDLVVIERAKWRASSGATSSW